MTTNPALTNFLRRLKEEMLSGEFTPAASEIVDRIDEVEDANAGA